MIDVAVDEGGAFLPTEAAEGGHVGDEVEVAVAEFPVGELVAGDGVHFGVGGEQVVAGVGAVAGDVVEEEPGVEALAHEAAVVIGEGGDDGVDVTGFGEAFEISWCEMGGFHELRRDGGDIANSKRA